MGTDFIFSDLIDSVTQRLHGLLEGEARTDRLADAYVRRLNYDAFLGFRHLWTDPALLDGRAAEAMLKTMADGCFAADRLFQFDDAPLIVVAARRKTLEDTLVAMVANGRHFACSIVEDDAEREQLAQHLLRFEPLRVTNLRSLIDVIRSSDIQKETIERLESHWQRCIDLEQQGVIRLRSQNLVDGKKMDFHVSSSFHRFGHNWLDLGTKWPNLPDASGSREIGRPLSGRAYEVLFATHQDGFNRSRFDARFNSHVEELLKAGTESAYSPSEEAELNDLLALRSYFYKAYNAEIARCNGVSYDLQRELGMFSLEEGQASFVRVMKGEQPSYPHTVVQTPTDLFAKITDLPADEFFAILKKARYEEWRNERNSAALERTIDGLCEKVGVGATELPGWVDTMMRGIAPLAGSAVGAGMVVLMDEQLALPDVAPDVDNPFDKITNLAATLTAKLVKQLTDAQRRRFSQRSRLKYDMLLRHQSLAGTGNSDSQY